MVRAGSSRSSESFQSCWAARKSMPCLARLESLLTGSNANSIGCLFYTFSALWCISESECPRPRDRLLHPAPFLSACRPPSQRMVSPDGSTKTQPGPASRQPPASLHGLQPLSCHASPARVHRRTHAHEPHQPTADVHGTARPRICRATANPAPAQDVARRILGSAWWARFTFNGITRCEKGTVALVGGEQLSDAEGGICWH